jgi:hypothetical protein
MVDTLLKIFLQQLHPSIAFPIAVVLAALLLSLVGKFKSFFDSVLTAEYARHSIPYIVVVVAIAHASLGVAASYWFYFHTDLFSPPVNPDLSQPLGRVFIRRSDWSLIAIEAALYVPLLAALPRNFSRLRTAAIVFILAIVPTAAIVAAFAIIQPAFITPNPAPPLLNTPFGFLWWYADVVLTSLPVGAVLVVISLLAMSLRRQP